MEQLPTPRTGKGGPELFIGDVYVDPVTQPASGVTAAWVHFTPGARNIWHVHGTGQTLHCTAGYGIVVTDDEVITLTPGVTVWTPPGQRHWHGALPDHAMTHLAISAIPAEPSSTNFIGDTVSAEEYAAAVERVS